jgi:hypothetical protein
MSPANPNLAGKAASCLALFCAVSVWSQQRVSPVRSDDSDWWSTIRVDEAPQTNIQHRQLASSTLEIMGIKVGDGEIGRAELKLVHVTIISRGDAATARTQACYIAGDSATHLIFEEQGEGFEMSFYLFQGGPNWNGSELCAKLPPISQPIQTADGLRLGLTRTEVEAVLGQPSTASANRLTYVLTAKKPTATNELTKLRREHAELSDEDFHESFDFYYVDSVIIARFTASKLTYLAVTQTESFP